MVRRQAIRKDSHTRGSVVQIYFAGADRMAFDFADCGLRRLTAPAHFWMARKFNRPEYSWFRYSELVGPARDGAVTHPGGAAEKACYADI